jgi:hypothetical protein
VELSNFRAPKVNIPGGPDGRVDEIAEQSLIVSPGTAFALGLNVQLYEILCDFSEGPDGARLSALVDGVRPLLYRWTCGASDRPS